MRSGRIEPLEGKAHTIHFQAAHRFFLIMIQPAYGLVARDGIPLPVVVVVVIVLILVLLIHFDGFVLSKVLDFGLDLPNVVQLLLGNLAQTQMRIMCFPPELHGVNSLDGQFLQPSDGVGIDRWKKVHPHCFNVGSFYLDIGVEGPLSIL